MHGLAVRMTSSTLICVAELLHIFNLLSLHACHALANHFFPSYYNLPHSKESSKHQMQCSQKLKLCFLFMFMQTSPVRSLLFKKQIKRGKADGRPWTVARDVQVCGVW